MSWSASVIGKPSEVTAKFAKALSGSRGQPRHDQLFDALESACEAVAGATQDESRQHVGTVEHITRRQVLVKSTGHFDSSYGGASFSIEMFNEYETIAATPAAIDTGAT